MFTSKKALIVVLAVVAACVAVFLLRHFPPSEQTFYPKCYLHRWTGLHCPGCGSTRAMHALVHGQAYEAMRYNPLLILGGPVFAIGLLWQRRLRSRTGRVSGKFGPAVAAVVLAFLFARNLPTPGTSWLAPPEASESPQDASQTNQDLMSSKR